MINNTYHINNNLLTDWINKEANNTSVKLKFKLVKFPPAWQEEKTEKKEFGQRILEKCIKEKHYAQIPHVIGRFAPTFREIKTCVEEPAFNFLLDKCIEMIPAIGKSSEFEGGDRITNAYLLLESLSNCLNEIDSLEHLNPEEKSTLKQIYQDLLQSFSFAIRWLEMDDSKTVANEILTLAKDPQVTFPILLISGANDHTTAVSFEKKPEQTLQRTLFSTGSGRTTHPTKNGMIQAFLPGITEPIENLDQRNLVDLVDAKIEPSISCFYQAFWKNLPPLPTSGSDLPHDYSTTQLQGTCSTHAQLAFLRYYFRKNNSGSDLHKLGIYKENKARILLQMFTKHVPDMDPDLQKLVQEKLELFHYDLALITTVQNQQAFEQALTQLNCQQEPTLKTVHEKYAFLRKLIKNTTNTNSTLDFARLLREKHIRENAHFKKIIKDETDPDTLKELLRVIHLSGSRYRALVNA